MPQSRVSTAAYLRRRAASYRALAQRTVSPAMVRMLLLMADEYETDADRIAAAANTTPPPPQRRPQADPHLD